MKPANCLDACVEDGLHSMSCPNVAPFFRTSATESTVAKQNEEIRSLKAEIDAMQKAIDGIAPFCKAKYGMDDEAVDAIHRLAYRSGPRIPEPPKMEENSRRCTCSEHLGEGCLTCGTPCPLHPNY